mgnify:CR=1 FL=1
MERIWNETKNVYIPLRNSAKDKERPQVQCLYWLAVSSPYHLFIESRCKTTGPDADEDIRIRNFWDFQGKQGKKLLTAPRGCNIISQCDIVRKCLIQAPVKVFYIIEEMIKIDYRR